MNEKMIEKKNLLRKMTVIAVCAFCFTFSLYAQKTVTGTVKNADDKAIAGVNVSVKGTSNGTTTDLNGTYSLNVQENEILVFSYVGYVTQEIRVTDQTAIPAILQEDLQELEELVVVGYGTQKKVNLTGAVASISSKDILTTKTGNIQNSLSGKIAGLKNYQKTSEPGKYNNDFSIRGMGAPLIVIDGVPRDNFVRLDMNEIESVSVLKDASASIYGVRAANGVILVTTKKGQRNTKFKLNYSGYYGVNQLLKPGQPLDAVGWMQLQNEKTLNGGSTDLPYPREVIDEYLNGTGKSTNWLQEANSSSPQTYHSVSATGGTDKLDYFASFGYDWEKGIWKSGDLNYRRFNLRSNVRAELAHGLKAEVLLNLMTDLKNQPSVEPSYNIYSNTFTQVPINPYYYVDEATGEIYYSNAANGMHPHFITSSDLSGYQKTQQRLVQTNMALEWEVPFVEGLKARGMYSYDYTENNNRNFRKKYTVYDLRDGEYVPANIYSPSTLTRQHYEHVNSMLQLSLSYSGKFNDHSVSAMLLYEESDRQGDNFSAYREFSMDALDQLFAGNTTNQQGTTDAGSGNLYHRANKGLIGRFNYDYASKYLAEFSFRYDGSSLFGEGRQWGFFPSAFLAWKLSEESFIKDSESLGFIDNLKLRASYGLMGDENASSYQFVTGYNYPSGGYVFGNDYVNAIASRGMANPNITWSSAAIVNIGLDAGFWNGLLGVEADIFRRDRTDMVATRSASLPGLVGANLPQENLESETAEGVELTLTHRNRIKDFHYNFSGNIALNRNKNKHKEIATQGNSYLNWRNNTNDRWQGLVWGRDYAGQYQSYEEIMNRGVIYDGSRGNSLMLPGDLIYTDWNGDGIIDGNDDHPISINNAGSPFLTYGFSLGAEYKGFDLNVVVQGTGMRWIRHADGFWYSSPLNWGRGGLDIFLDRWHREDQYDPNSKWVPGFYPSTWADNGRSGFTMANSTFWMVNCSYFRVKSLEVGYTLPAKIVGKVGLQSLRVFFNSYNLLTISDLTYCDPEFPNSEYTAEYPNSRSFNFGLQITF
ncbi:MAG: TonB-dependent receptor [Dysgonamonadaceae bacterium]|jgi:TonB-linked SusC/RagA family outer membrane protein|nr:TonB-dependent receptor [Dysgonamonadaceae bacterium]